MLFRQMDTDHKTMWTEIGRFDETTMRLNDMFGHGQADTMTVHL